MQLGDAQNIDFDLLAKYFAGELAVDQIIEIEKWRDESEENLAEFNRLKTVWVDTGVSGSADTELPIVDVDQAWEKVNQQIEPMHSKRSYRWLSVAASVVVLLGVVSWWLIPGEESWIVNGSTTNMQVTCILPDESDVLLNEFSSLMQRASFGKKERAVKLEGEAFFDVERNPDVPFVIHVGDTKVEVLGTSFNINGRHAEDSVVVVVETGVVRLSHGNEKIELTKGMKGVAYPAKGEVKVVEMIGGEQYWRTKKLVFQRHTLQEVVHSLEKVYGVHFELANDKLKDCRYSAEFENETLENILAIISATLGLEVEKKNGVIYLSGDEC